MESLDPSSNYPEPHLGLLGSETPLSLLQSNSLLPPTFSGSYREPLLAAEENGIEGMQWGANGTGGSSLFPNSLSTFPEGSSAAVDRPLVDSNARSIVADAIASASNKLVDFSHQSDPLSGMRLAFGDNWQAETAVALVQNLAEGEIFPQIEILSREELGARGAFAAETNTIYLAAEFLNENANNLETISAVILEEAGHFLDSQLNSVDSQGDEGALFSALVTGQTLTSQELAALKAEDDSGTLNVGGKTFAVEHADEPGVFTVGELGRVAIDFLTDSGSYVGEVGIFSLKGMEGLVRGSVEFIQEAARRVLSNSPAGYIAISDASEGGRFSGELGESNLNVGDYPKAKSLAMTPDEKFALMLMPNGKIEEVASNPNADVLEKQPLFSITSANPGSGTQMAQVVPKSVDGGVFAFEDLRLDIASDRDYNDLIFKVSGATGFATPLSELLAPERQWQATELGQKLIKFASEELSTATDLGAFRGNKTLNGSVGDDNPIDVYRFTLDAASTVDFVLNGLSADADLYLIEDVNGNGILDDEALHSGEIIDLSELEGAEAEKISTLLQAGTYFIQVEQYEGNTNYNLGLNITPFTPPADTAPNTLPTARDLGVLSGEVPPISEYVGDSDTVDYFKFSVSTQSDFDLEINDSTGDVAVRLIRDANNNGIVDSGEVIDSSDVIGDEDEYLFAPDLQPGNYFVEVKQVNGESTYNLLMSLLASTTPPDNAGNSLSAARDLGVLNGVIPTINDSVNVRDRKDFYKFSLTQTSTVNITLSGLSSDADLYLIRNTDSDDDIDAGEIIVNSTRAAGNEIISLNLAAGDYIIEVFDALGDTTYDMDVSGTPTADPPTPITPALGSSLLSPIVQAGASFEVSGTVDESNPSQFYKFNVSQTGIFTANLTGLVGDADVRLIRDYNNNNKIDEAKDRNNNVYIDKEEVEIIAWQPNRDNSNESIRAFLQSGDYYLEVKSHLKATTNFNVVTAFQAAATDPLEFRIKPEFTKEAQKTLSETKHSNGETLLKTVEEAANYWSRVITHSSFNDRHTIEVTVNIAQQGKYNLADARPTGDFVKDSKGRSMATKGISNINIFTPVLEQYKNYPRFLYDTMIHEFGHIIGFWGDSPKDLKEGNGSAHSWNDRKLVDLDINNLDASKNKEPKYIGEYATIAYGALLGTNQQTPIPLTIGKSSGSDYSHWSKEYLEAEAQTESGEKDVLAPFAEISVAATRDLGFNVNYGAAEPFVLKNAKA